MIDMKQTVAQGLALRLPSGKTAALEGEASGSEKIDVATGLH